jgi:hypothetical protein
MSNSTNHFAHNAGSQNEQSVGVNQTNSVNNQAIKMETKPKNFIQKIRAALQDWSNSGQ